MQKPIAQWRPALVNLLRLYRWPQPVRRLAILKLIPKRSATDFPFTVDLHGMIYRGNTNNFIDYKVLTDGSFEPGLIALMLRIAKEFGGNETTFVDVGANVGHHSLILSRYFRTVIAVEPYSPALERMAERLSENRVDNVRQITVGFSNKFATVAFEPPPTTNLGLGSIRGDGVESIETCPGDDLLFDHKPAITLVKVDVEGHELAVLEGLQNTLRKHRPFLIAEIMNMDAGERESIRSLLPAEYCISKVDRQRSGTFTLPIWSGEHADEVLCWPSEANIATVA